MAKKPSSSSNRIRPDESLNLAPLIDMVTCLMFFLLAFAGIMPVAIIDAPLPKIASTAEEVKIAKDNDNKLDVTVDIAANSVTVKEGGGTTRTFQADDKGVIPFVEVHKHLVAIHAKKPKAHEITLVPQNAVTYEVIIGVMDAARALVKGDAGFEELPPGAAQTADSLSFNRLFPDVSIGGV